MGLPSLFTALVVSATALSFDPLHHSGGASPYFEAPLLPGLGPEVPSQCVVEQAAYFVRHGSRYPEPGSFTGWQNLFIKIQNATFTARGPLTFLPSWIPPVDNVDHEPLYLSSTGSQESFDLGVQLRKQYGLTAGGGNFTVWSASQQRVVDTATYFLRGYLSAGNYLSTPSLNRGHVIILPDSLTAAQSANVTQSNNSTDTVFADSLTPSASCPAYGPFSNNGSTTSNIFRATYQSSVAERLNGFLEGDLVLDASDVGVMQDLCGFGFEVSGDRRFCDIFTEGEWLDYEYAADLNYYYGSGPGNPLSATVGYPWIKAVADLFAVGPNETTSGGTLTPPPLMMGFLHDNNIPPLISALGLWNDTVLSPTHRPPSDTDSDPNEQRFRSSHAVAFRGYVAMERMTCSATNSSLNGSTLQSGLDEAAVGIFHQAQAGVLGTAAPGSVANTTQTFIRILTDNAPVPIPSCDSGPGRTCPLSAFLDLVDTSLREVAGVFAERCGLAGLADVSSDVKFLTTEGDGARFLLGIERPLGT